MTKSSRRQVVDDLLSLSKKIAQLTKVIFHLNTKNDENEQQIKAVTASYEAEIDL